MKYFCFRFDIDSQKCLREGVPNLLVLGKQLKVHFTFFVNFGRAVNQVSFLRDRLSKQRKENESKSLSAFAKLGLKDYVITALYNPLIIKGNDHILQQIIESGHELGLHGGKNHDDWFRKAHKWPVKKIREELVWGQQLLKQYIPGEAPYGFSSPGWNTSADIRKILHELKFSYIADIHSDKPIETVTMRNGIACMPTNITGEPGGVGYIEYCRASLMDDPEILRDFKNKLITRKKLAIVYDHPYYAGVREIGMVKKMLQTAIRMDYAIVTMRDILQKI